MTRNRPAYCDIPRYILLQPASWARSVAKIPVGRLGEPDEIAAAVEFIFTNDFLNGRILEIDGGQRL